MREHRRLLAFVAHITGDFRQLPFGALAEVAVVPPNARPYPVRPAVTIPRFLSDQLGEHITALPGDDCLIFQAPRGGPIRYSNFIRRVWQRALAEAGLPDMGIHALRHTCAALLIAQGAHPKAIQSHLGHRSITTTLDRYGHLFDDEHSKPADRLDDAYTSLLPEAPEDSHEGEDSGHVAEGAR